MIRAANLNDIPSLIEIEKLSFLLSDQFNKRQLRYSIRSNKSLIFIFADKTGIIPFGYIYFKRNKNHVRIYSLAVHPDSRNRNIAFKLLEFVEQGCKHLGKIKLEVRADNTKAFCFYDKAGYIVSGMKYNYYADGMDAIIMKKDLLNAKR